MDVERARRVNENQQADEDAELERASNIALAKSEVQDEQRRRQVEDAANLVRESLVQDYRVQMAMHLAETERLRRMTELSVETHALETARKVNQSQVIVDMEAERTRRVTSPEHMTKMKTFGSPKERRSQSSLEPLSKTVLQEPERLTTKTSLNEIQLMESQASPPTITTLPIESLQFEAESQALVEIKTDLASELRQAKPYEEMVGDIRLLRFLRGYNLNVPLAAKHYRAFLQWRTQVGMDAIRDEIVAKNWSTVDFPGYKELVKYIPFVNMYDVCDRDGNIICYERSGYIDTPGTCENVATCDFFLMDSLSRLSSRFNVQRQ